MHVFILNGPKFTGKDTITKLLLKLFPNAIHARMKDILYSQSYENWRIERRDMSFDEWVALCNDPNLKDVPVSWLGSHDVPTRSPREALIYISEEVIKARHGETGVSKRTVEILKHMYPDYKDRIVVFSDGGFNVEIENILAEFDIKRSNMTIIRIDRKGCTYKGDSREYIRNPDYMYTNNRTPIDLLGKVKQDIAYLRLDKPILAKHLVNVKLVDIVPEIELFKVP